MHMLMRNLSELRHCHAQLHCLVLHYTRLLHHIRELAGMSLKQTSEHTTTKSQLLAVAEPSTCDRNVFPVQKSRTL